MTFDLVYLKADIWKKQWSKKISWVIQYTNSVQNIHVIFGFLTVLKLQQLTAVMQLYIVYNTK